MTIPTRDRLRRSDGEAYRIHYEDLRPDQIGWVDQIPTVTPATAIAQCLVDGTPDYLLRQAIDAGRKAGRSTATEAAVLRKELRHRRTG